MLSPFVSLLAIKWAWHAGLVGQRTRREWQTRAIQPYLEEMRS